SISRPLTVIFIETKTAAPSHRGCGRVCSRRVPFAGITRSRFEGSRAAPGSQESSPHDARGSIPARTTRILSPFDLATAQCYLVRPGSATCVPSCSRRERAHEANAPPPIPPNLGRYDRRRRHLARAREGSRLRAEARADVSLMEPFRPCRGRRASQAGGGVFQGGGRQRAGGHHRAPAAHGEIRGRGAVAIRSRHDRTHDPIRFLFESQLDDVGDVVDKLGKQQGGWYPFAAEACQTKSGWRAVPWFWISFPATYNMAHFKKAGLEYPKSWDELLKQGK